MDSFDYLIIGSGVAGMFAALKAAEKKCKVALLSKKSLEECNTKYAQGGICCVLDKEDSFQSHINDTLEAGADLCNLAIVEQIVTNAPDRINDLINFGVNFTRKSDVDPSYSESNENGYDLAKEGGHNNRRILHAKDMTGSEIVSSLVELCKANKYIDIFQYHHAIDLITTWKMNYTDLSNQVLGAYVLDTKNNKVRVFRAKKTILASGGSGKVYKYTTNPDIATGDGIAMAYRAYANIANMEFFQFHPTCLYHKDEKSFLISEAVRGEGAILKIKNNNSYEEFMSKVHEKGSLAPRDIVAREIDRKLKESGQECAYLDITCHSEEYLKCRFPAIFNKLYSLNINMAKDLIPVVPAAHYCCGGIKAKVDGTTNVKDLYAIGEVASTGLHGANRLASNSLLEAVVMADLCIANTCNNLVDNNSFEISNWSDGNATCSDELVVITHNWAEIRSFMWNYVGIFRTDKRLQRAKRRIRNIQQEISRYYWNFLITEDLIELRNLACVAELIIDSSLMRQESRGLHFNQDYPDAKKEKVESLLQRCRYER